MGTRQALHGGSVILSIGEILFDVFPQYRRIGGAPFNFAYHLRGLGFPVRFVSRVGKDEAGQEILSFIAGAGFTGSDIQIDADRATGTVEVELDDEGVPRFTILENVAYDSIAFDDTVKAALNAGPAMICFGSLIQRTRQGFSTIRRVLADQIGRAHV